MRHQRSEPGEPPASRAGASHLKGLAQTGHSGNGRPLVSGKNTNSTIPTRNSKPSPVTAHSNPIRDFSSPESQSIGAATKRPPLKQTAAPVARNRLGESSGK